MNNADIEEALESVGLLAAVYRDVEPTFHDDGPNPVCPINYPRRYRVLMGLLRTLVAKSEKSRRVYDLTTKLLLENPAHYTIWHYRQDLLSVLDKDLNDELCWTESLSEDNLKNYQLWHHRMVLTRRLMEKPESERGEWTMQGELDAVERLLQLDEKNYHAWSYRIGLIKEFNQYDLEAEPSFIQRMLDADIRNNSVWNYCFFFYMREARREKWKEEVDRAKDAIQKVINNESPWAYLRGVLRKMNSDLRSVEDFVISLSSNEYAEASAQWWRAKLEIAELKGQADQAVAAADRLCKVDQIRLQYWQKKMIAIEAK